QIGYEINQSFGGNYLFSGFRMDEPPVFIEDNNRSFVITQNFHITDISREASFQRLVVPGGLGTFEPVSYNINVIKLAYTGLDAQPVIPGFEVRTLNITDPDAYRPPVDNGASPAVPVLHYIPETGELVMHSDTASAFPREGVSVTYQKTGFRQDDINPMVYFTGREIVDLNTSHIQLGTELVYNVTQNFSRAAGTPVPAVGTPTSYNFTLAYTPMVPAPADLMASLPHGATIAGNVVNIPAHVMNTTTDVSVTYPVRLMDTPVVGGVHIMADTRVQGAELVRAIGVDNIAIPLNTIEINKSFDMKNQEIQYEFASRTRVTVNSLAKNVVTDKMFADFRRFFEFSDSLYVSTEYDLQQHFRSLGYSEEAIKESVEKQLTKENAMARDALHKQFNNMLYLIDKHVDNSTREQTLLGSRMIRMELIQNRLEDDEGSYTKLTSDNEDTNLIHATILRYSAEALFQASLMANGGVIQMSIANFLR
ncbi:MAG: hypothetical protein LBI27_06510, partial [Clostridiales bacterium]|nr:hypothetical protein [Clostridiales bacterium]